MQAIRDLDTLLNTMQPVLQPGRYVFASLPPGQMLDQIVQRGAVVASIREPEGLSVVLAEQDAIALGLPIAFTAAWITLGVHSDLAAVGLTAAFSSALARAGVSCNVVAGVRHDHLFVPAAQAQRAMDALQALQRSAAI
jgi:hypothetical protein